MGWSKPLLQSLPPRRLWLYQDGRATRQATGAVLKTVRAERLWGFDFLLFRGPLAEWLSSVLLSQRGRFDSFTAYVRKVTRDVTVSEPITLDDLRWIVEQCKDFEPTSQVSVKEHKSYDQRDWDAATITVHGAESR